MNIQEYNKTIAILVHLIVMNNAAGVVKALKEQGYNTQKYIPAPALEAALLQLHAANVDSFFKAMESIKWNPGHVSTNQTEVIRGLIKLTREKVGPSVDNTNWWPSLIKYIASVPVKNTLIIT